MGDRDPKIVRFVVLAQPRTEGFTTQCMVLPHCAPSDAACAQTPLFSVQSLRSGESQGTVLCSETLIKINKEPLSLKPSVFGVKLLG